ncbi:MAG: TonB family protein [Pseudomonadota bacterium]
MPGLARYGVAVIGALAITVAVFLFMQNLIKSRQQQNLLLPVYSQVEILRDAPEEEEEPEPEETEPEEPMEEPLMDSLEIAPPTPEPVLDLEVAALDLALGDIKVQAAGERWLGPVGRGVGAVNLSGGDGEDAQGFIEVIPFDTRRPNVPDVAYENRISGWVLVAFQVSADGTTRNVRVLDANPRGVFEEKVVAAVSDWRYRVNFYGGATGAVVLTQKVDVSWENYPQNLPNVD